MADEKITNQALLLQIVRDIEILKANSIQILQSSQDHEARIRELEAFKWRIAGITSLVGFFSAVIIEVLARTIFK